MLLSQKTTVRTKRQREDTVLRHLGHEVVVVEEEEADHSDDEEGSASGLVWGAKQRESVYVRNSCTVQSPTWPGWSGDLIPHGLTAGQTATTHLILSSGV